MSYTAIEKMRQENLKRFRNDLGPFQPTLYQKGVKAMDLKSSALRFIHNSCEGLCFSKDKTDDEKDGMLLGASLKAGQIPYDMQMDINRLCLERELEKFIDSGVAEDAYTVYYCYLKMFFGEYGKSKKMVELLSEFESNGSSLLMKHRDHYSHSVYVFTLGLAIYETNSKFRKTFAEFYGLDITEEKGRHEAACLFLEYWGLAALFHDIGYPFELPFEQVLSYFEVGGRKRGEKSFYLVYRNIDTARKLDEEASKRFASIYGREFKTTDELLAYDIARKLGDAYGFSEEYILEKISTKPTHPEKHDYFMDHAYFSSIRLCTELCRNADKSPLNSMHVDALSAIMLHNSLFKFCIADYKGLKGPAKAPLKMELHPLAYMLMLCDELQCGDRTAYGRNSRTELHPMAADFDFSSERIKATYYYDEDEKDKIDQYMNDYEAWLKGKKKDKPRLKAYSDMAGKEQRFKKDIEKIVDTKPVPLVVICSTKPVDRKIKHTYLSGSNFLHLYDFAVALNGRYTYDGKERDLDTKQLEDEFDILSLEYQLSNINQAKSFSRYLNAIKCFYTDRPVDFPMITAFTSKQTAVFAPMEHERWVREHISMGWKYGEAYEMLTDDPAERKVLREQFRMHKLAMDGDPTEKEIKKHYDGLSEYDKGKDWLPFNNMLALIKLFDGLRIYKLEQEQPAKGFSD